MNDESAARTSGHGASTGRKRSPVPRLGRSFLIPTLVLLAATALAAATIPDPAAMDDETFERELAARFQYGPPQPAPVEVTDRRDGQQVDADYLARFPEFDRAYSPAARAEAARLVVRLRAEARDLDHEQFVLRVAEIAALADNAHTALGENAFRKNTPRLPLRSYPFADGLYVLRARPADADLLGARIERIDGRPVAALRERLRRYAGGTSAHRDGLLLPVLESPALLHAAGLAETPDALTLAGVRADGSVFDRRIRAEPRNRSAPVSSTARLLFPADPDDPLPSFLGAGAPRPASLRDADHLFTTQALPDGGLYVGLAHNADADESPIRDFLAGVLARLRAEHPSFVVLDMRMNGGGDYTTTYAFARALPAAAGGASVYVLTSGWTFSAAITTVAALKDAGGNRVTIVGEPVGDRLDFWAEGGSFVLPNAFLVVHYAAGRHNYGAPCTDRETCFWLNDRFPVRVTGLDPDIAAPMRFADYRQGRDSALEAVLARHRRTVAGPR